MEATAARRACISTAALGWRHLHARRALGTAVQRARPALRCSRVAAHTHATPLSCSARHARLSQLRGNQRTRTPPRSVVCRAVDPWSVSPEARAASMRACRWRRLMEPANAGPCVAALCSLSLAILGFPISAAEGAGPAAHLLRLCFPAGVCIRHHPCRRIRFVPRFAGAVSVLTGPFAQPNCTMAPH